jgi:hypothetical protein
VKRGAVGVAAAAVAVYFRLPCPEAAKAVPGVLEIPLIVCVVLWRVLCSIRACVVSPVKGVRLCAWLCGIVCGLMPCLSCATAAS